jgi:hypothetical protein
LVTKVGKKNNNVRENIFIIVERLIIGLSSEIFYLPTISWKKYSNFFFEDLPLNFNGVWHFFLE